MLHPDLNTPDGKQFGEVLPKFKGDQQIQVQVQEEQHLQEHQLPLQANGNLLRPDTPHLPRLPLPAI